jgi:cytochrome c553
VSTRSGIIAASVVALLATAVTAYAQILQPLTRTGDAARGEQLAYTCTGCHGVDSAVNAYPTYHVPKLGGQNADYIEIALQGYRDGSRGHPTMHAQASQLSDQDIVDLSAYFESLESAPESGVSSAGNDKVLAGRDRSTTCQACHGAAGIAASAQWPNLAGQHASYLLEAMLQYQRGERSNGVMVPLVAELDRETLAEIAAFYAAQDGLFQTGR